MDESTVNERIYKTLREYCGMSAAAYEMMANLAPEGVADLIDETNNRFYVSDNNAEALRKLLGLA